MSADTQLPLLVKSTVVAKPQTVRFQGVYWHKGIQAYTTRTATGETYKTPRAAAKAIGVVKKNLKPSTVLSRVRAYHRIYGGNLPADVDDMHKRAPVLRKLVLEEPSIEPLILQLKYGPWRSAVVQSWRQHRSSVQCPVFTKRTLQERARSLRTVLVAAVREVAKTGVSRFWPRNCGRSVGWHAGGTAVLRHLGVIVAARSAGHVMRFHDRSAGDADSDDADDDESKRAAVTAWKFGTARRSTSLSHWT